MKKKLITIVIGAMLCAGLIAGCGQSDTKQDKAAGTENAKQAETCLLYTSPSPRD